MSNSDKAALRQAVAALRDQLSSDDRDAGRRALRSRTSDLPIHRGAWVSGYLPIGSEIDPVPLMTSLLMEQVRLCLPIVAGRGRPLQFRAWAPGDDLATVQWGLREPKDDQPVVVPDVMLAPLLAIDRAGNRLGYGAGYYDRTIAAIREAGRAVTTIGLAFDVQIIDAVPHMDYDVPLDAILTPSGLIRCQGAA